MNEFKNQLVGRLMPALTPVPPLKAQIGVASVPYQADPVSELAPTPAIAAELASRSTITQAKGVADWYFKAKPFFASIDIGRDVAYSDLTARASICPHEILVLAGYSQGAMAMHRLLLKLVANGQTAILNRIRGVALIADGDRVRKTVTGVLGNPAAGWNGSGVADLFDISSGQDIPSRVVPYTADVCQRHDIVCDPNFRHLAGGLTSHTSYANPARAEHDGLLDGVGVISVLLNHLPYVAAPSDTLTGTAGSPLSFTLTTTVKAGYRYEWQARSGLPAGLTLNTFTGQISGTPTTSGSGTAHLRVRTITPPNHRYPWLTYDLKYSITQTIPTAQPTPTVPSGMVSAGGDGTWGFTCAVVSGGTVKCWGNNRYGQLGDGTTTSRSTPTSVPGLTGVTAISAGAAHTCALVSGGTVKCWGSNSEGELGDGTALPRMTPVAVPGLTGVTTVAAGYTHTCALLTDGTIRCWGDNGAGDVGDGSTTPRYSPVAVPGITGATAVVTAGLGYTCALLSDGTVKCWGSDVAGALGIDGDAQHAPVGIPGLTGVTAITAQGTHTCALLSSGNVDCWGDDAFGQLGDGTDGGGSSGRNRSNPIVVSELAGVTAIAAGMAYTCALVSGGTVKCWGANTDGLLGDGSTEQRDTPVAVSGLTGVTAISAGDSHTCALLTDGTVKCWGYNREGQLGDGTTTDASTPVTVIGL